MYDKIVVYMCSGQSPSIVSPKQLLPQTKAPLAISSPITTNGLLNVLFDVICSETV